MRTIFGGLAMAASVGGVVLVGCGSEGDKQHSKHAEHAEHHDTHAAQTAGPGSCTLQSGGQTVLRLTLPEGTPCTSEEGVLHVRSRSGYFDVWVVNAAAGVPDGVAQAGTVIAPEFTGFHATTTSAATVAGSPATHLVGSGAEADDNDPGTAEVVVFKLADRVFVACTHGETLAPSSVQFMMTSLQTAQRP
jgi:hypothetical protein